MKFEINKQNKKTIKEVIVANLLLGTTIFTIDRNNGRIVEITGFSMKTRSFKWRYQGKKTISTDWSVQVGEIYSSKSYELCDEQTKIIARKMR